MVLDAVHVAGVVGFALAGVGESTAPVNVVDDAAGKIARIVLSTPIKGCVRGNINATQRIDKINGGIEVDADVVIYINIQKFLYRTD